MVTSDDQVDTSPTGFHFHADDRLCVYRRPRDLRHLSPAISVDLLHVSRATALLYVRWLTPKFRLSIQPDTTEVGYFSGALFKSLMYTFCPAILA